MRDSTPPESASCPRFIPPAEAVAALRKRPVFAVTCITAFSLTKAERTLPAAATGSPLTTTFGEGW